MYAGDELCTQARCKRLVDLNAVEPHLDRAGAVTDHDAAHLQPIPGVEGDDLSRGVTNAAMAHPEPTGSVLAVDIYQPRASGVEEAEDWHIAAAGTLRLDVEHAVGVDIRVGNRFTEVGAGG